MTCHRSSAATAAHRTRHPWQEAQSWLQTRVYRLAFERQNSKRTFMHAAQRLPFDKPLQGFDAERELAQGERTLGAQATRPQPLKILRGCVLRSVDDPKVLFATALHGGLDQSALVPGDELEGLDDHSLAAGAGQIPPPLNGCRHLLWYLKVHNSVWRGDQNFAIRIGQFAQNCHVPLMIFVSVNGSFAGQQMEGCELEVEQ